MKLMLFVAPAVPTCYANDNDAYIPELWANESLAILLENMVMANMVHRDFSDEVANWGDVVNTRRPGEFKVRRTNDDTNITQQDAKSTNVRVPLDQWFYNSFVIKDGEASLSFKDLIGTYIEPAMQVMGRSIDRALHGRVHDFLSGPTGRAGRLGGLTGSNAKTYLLEARQILNENKAGLGGRNLVVSPGAETALLTVDDFIQADKRGDGGAALEEARLGRVLGFDTFMTQNVNSVSTGVDTNTAATVTNALAAGVGGAQAVSGGVAATVGEFYVVEGNDQPTYVTAATGATSVTLNEVNKFATGAAAPATHYLTCDVAGAYAVNHELEVVVDGYNSPPQVGQLIAFGTGGSRRTYTIIEADVDVPSGGSTSILLDRPLEVALADNDPAFPGPTGDFNLAFQRNSIALVTRPLVMPRQGTGVATAVASFNGVGMRVTMQYDINAGGTVVKLDLLAGTAILDNRLGVVLLG